MTEPSQYFKGRTVQEQMNEVIGYVDTRAAEVATTAIASDVAQVHQDMLNADADASAAAASAAAAAGTLANAVKKTGEASQSIAGDIAVAGDLSAGGDATAVNIRSTGTLYADNNASVGRNLGVGGTTSVVDLTATGIVSVPAPTGNNHAANKKYVDDKDALDVKITDINNYAVGLTGNQPNITGDKGFTGTVTANFYRTGGSDGYRRINLDRSDDELAVAPASVVLYPLIAWNDKNNNLMSAIYVSHLPNGTTSISMQTRNSDGTIKYTTLAQGDVI